MPRLPLLLLSLALAACVAPPSGEPNDGSPPTGEETTTRPADDDTIGREDGDPTAGADAPDDGESGPAPSSTLLSRTPTDPRAGYAALGLTGEEKPNGPQQRLRRSVPDATPAYVPRTRDGMELWIADPTPDGWLAFWRTPLARSTGPENAGYRVALFGADGEAEWEIDLNPLLSRPDGLEIQDVRYDGGDLFLNEACRSYAREADGRCSSLLRVDPRAGRVVWRTEPLVSNDVLLVRGPWIVAGYGFTAEPDAVFLVDRGTGDVVAEHALDAAHSYLETRGDTLAVVTRSSLYRFHVGG